MSTPATASDVPPGSSPAPSSPAPSAQSVLDSMSEAERSQWELTGDLPGTKTTPAGSSPASTDADSSPAAPAAQAASTDAHEKAASEPATPPKTAGHKGNAETRVQELLASERRYREDIARLQGQLEALTRTTATPDAKPGSSPATPPTQAEYERYLAMPDAPREEDFDTYAKFTTAMSVFITDQRWQEHTQRAGAEARVQHAVARVSQTSERAQTRIQDFQKTDPEFASKVNPGLLEIEPATVRLLRGEKVGPQHQLAEEILHSEVMPQLLIHFSTEEGQKEWGRLCALPPADRLRAFGRLEGRFEGASRTTEPPPAPEPKTLSTAPAPKTQLGTRPTEPIDPSEAALKRKDITGFIEAENARELAAMGLTR